MRIVAASSDPRALPCLEGFTTSPNSLLALLTAPERGRGRGREAKPSELVLWAKAREIPVLQPEDVNSPEVLTVLRGLAPDALAVIAYGQKLGPELLALPKHGCLNLHPSLLPRWRGAAPIPRAILAGEAETGVCIIRMVDRMDAGPVLASAPEPILPEDTAESLGDRLFGKGAGLFIEVLEKLRNGCCEEIPQDEALATKAPKLKKEDGLIDWRRDAGAVERQVRALQPWPGAYATLPLGKGPVRLTVWKARAVDAQGAPGDILKVPGEDLVVACGQGAISLLEIQAEGKRRMPVADFLRGLRG